MNLNFFLFLIPSALSGCVLFNRPPEAIPAGERLAALSSLPKLPVSDGSKILWNSYQVPYVIGETDRDGAFLFGLAHAHLRLGQMELFKRVGSGRLSEIAGPLVYDVDVAIRSLGIARAAKEIYTHLPDETREWIDAFTQGVNFYKENVRELPHDFTIMGFDNSEPWRPEDSLIIARLTGADINWFAMLGLLKLKETESYERLYTLLQSTAKWGSNSVVVDANRSATGSALVANDPHLGFTMPNFWIIAGLKTPSYKMVGMAVPGTPVFGFGRTPHLAWGGTNMRGWASDFVDVTDISEEKITRREESFGIRWWPDDSEEIRITPYGPIVSDLDVFDFPEGKDIALRWIGGLPIDDITPFLKASKARNGTEFRDAFQGYALPALNILYADNGGDTGHILATTLPKRNYLFPDNLWRSMKDSDADWANLQDASTLPAPEINKDGIITSSNNNPIPGKLPAVGWYFSPDDRALRAQSFLEQRKQITLEDLKALQRDVYSAAGIKFRDALLGFFKDGKLDKDQKSVVQILSDWDGNYSTDSRGAVLIEVVLKSLAEDIYREREEEAQFLGRAQLLRMQVIHELQHMDKDLRHSYFLRALRKGKKPLESKTTWGDLHTLTVGHVLSGLPVIGSRYKIKDVPAPGSRQTFMKSAHGLVDAKHKARFGSQSRHLSDLSDLDANYFVLLGGQDGFIGSENFADQYSLWQNGEYIQMPLTDEIIEHFFRE